ncbi:MAG: hypothetical protein EBR82_33365 [Caulobacteraceae bacterium]|nr:hypothetical protein [Caulobacteraceae bacterium]
MQAFDSTLWMERAWARYTRAVRRGAKKPSLEPRWARDVTAIGNLGKLIEWCEGRGLQVKFARRPNGGSYEHDEKIIYLSHRAGPETQVAYLLHECGHHLIGMKEHHERFGMGYPKSADPSISRTMLHRVAVLEEELEAWHRGWRLAERLGLFVSRKVFDRIRMTCIKSYVSWTLGRSK